MPKSAVAKPLAWHRSNVHPTAVVDPQAQIDESAIVGPYCVLEGPVVIGAGTRLMAHVYVLGPARIGQDNQIYPFACIGAHPQDLKFDARHDKSTGVVIGDRNRIREGVTVHGATHEQPTTIGNDNLLMSNVHVAHDVTIGSHCVLASGALLGGHVHLANQVLIGGNGAVHQFCRVGRLAFIGGVSAISSDLPPFAEASGLNKVMGINRVGLRRNGHEQCVNEVKAAFDTLYLASHTRPVAVKLIEQRIQELRQKSHPAADLLQEIIDFVATSTRGLVPHAMTDGRQALQR